MKLSKQDLIAVEKAQQIILEDYRWCITISSLSQKVCINERKLKYGFRRKYAISIHAFLIKVRMEKAIELLLQSEKSVELVSKLVGYKDRTSFSREFKKRFGRSPSKLNEVMSITN